MSTVNTSVRDEVLRRLQTGTATAPAGGGDVRSEVLRRLSGGAPAAPTGTATTPTPQRTVGTAFGVPPDGSTIDQATGRIRPPGQTDQQLEEVAYAERLGAQAMRQGVPMPSTPGQAAGLVWRAANEPLANVFQGLEGTRRSYAGGAADVIGTGLGLVGADQSAEAFHAAGSELGQEAAGLQGASAGGRVGGMLGDSVPALVAVLATRGRLAGRVGPTMASAGRNVPLGVMGTAAAGQGIQDYRQSVLAQGGKPDPLKEAAVGAAYATAEILFERIGIDATADALHRVGSGVARAYMLGDLPAAAQVITGVAKAAGVNAAEEWGTQLAQNGISAIYDAERSILEGTDEAAVAGGLQGALMGGSGAVMEAGRQAWRPTRAPWQAPATEQTGPVTEQTPQPPAGVGGGFTPSQQAAADRLRADEGLAPPPSTSSITTPVGAPPTTEQDAAIEPSALEDNGLSVRPDSSTAADADHADRSAPPLSSRGETGLPAPLLTTTDGIPVFRTAPDAAKLARFRNQRRAEGEDPYVIRPMLGGQAFAVVSSEYGKRQEAARVRGKVLSPSTEGYTTEVSLTPEGVFPQETEAEVLERLGVRGQRAVSRQDQAGTTDTPPDPAALLAGLGVASPSPSPALAAPAQAEPRRPRPASPGIAGPGERQAPAQAPPSTPPTGPAQASGVASLKPTPDPDQVAQDIERHAQRWEELSKKINPDVPISPNVVREKVVPRIVEAITTGKFNDFLRPDNKVSRALFEELTGVKLPKTIRDTEALFTGKPFAFASKTANPPESPDSSTTPAGDAERLRARLKNIENNLQGYREIAEQGGYKSISKEKALRQLEALEQERGDVISKLRALGDDETAPEAKPTGILSNLNDADRARLEELKKRLAKKLGTELRSGFDPEMFAIGAETALYVKAGAKKFGAYARQMVADLGDAVRPYLKSFYNGARDMPGVDASGMDPYDSVSGFDLASLDERLDDKPEQAGTKVTGGGGRVRGGTRRPDQQTSTRPQEDADGGTSGSPELPAPEGTGVPDQPGATPRGRRSGGRGGRAGAGKPTARPEPGAGPDHPGPRGTDEAAAPLRPERPKNVADRNHRIGTKDVIAPKGDEAKIRGNLEAIRILQKIEAAKRNATPDEKRALAQYVGWGSTGVARALDSLKAKRAEQFREEQADYERELKEWADNNWPEYRKPSPPDTLQFEEAMKWEKEYGDLYREIRDLVSDADFRDMQASTPFAHYTSADVIRRGIWGAVRRLGFKGGNVLETSAGVGHMIGLQPEDLAGISQWTAVELDSIPARILAKLYPEANVINGDFGTAKITPASIDLIVGNVPFAASNTSWEGQPKGLSLHNAFLARSIRMLRPGGLCVVITSRSTMDERASDGFREWAARDANLVGAVRLPEVAFMQNAGTKVTTDILVFQKKRDTTVGAEWAERKKITVPNRRQGGEIEIDLNEYFHDHPEMMLGKLVADGLYPDSSELDSTMEWIKGTDWLKSLDDAVQKLPADLAGEGSYERPAASGEGEGTIGLHDGASYQVIDGRRTPITGKREAFFRAFVPLKATTLKLFEMQVDEKATDADIEKQREQVRSDYRAFVKAHGRLGESFKDFRSDPASFRVASLEKIERTLSERSVRGVVKYVFNETYGEADILTRRTQHPFIEPDKADTLEDAIALSVVWKGMIDLDYLAKLRGDTSEGIRHKLLEAGKVFVDPDSGKLAERDEYLSGLVVEKLAKAEAAAKNDAAYAPNVEALKAVQPIRKDITKVSTMLGASWVPPEAFEAFAAHALGVEDSPISVVYSDVVKAHQAHAHSPDDADVAAGSGGIPLSQIIAKTINFERVVVMVPGDKPGSVRQDPEATAAVQYKQEQLQKKWERWMRGSDWALRLEDAYNAKVNISVRRKYTPPAVDILPGADPSVKLRDHQKRDISRALQHSHLNSHEVGTGKTFIIISTAMEMKRLGLARKPMIVVQNSTVGSYARSFARLYPSARVLVPSDKDFEAKNRKRTLQSIASNDWDAVIIPQSQLEKVRNDPNREREYVAEMIDELEEAIVNEGVDPEKARFSRDPKVKVLARRYKAVKDLAAKLLDNTRKDTEIMTFEEMGVDSLLVDEAHAYKKLAFVTVLPNIKGMDTGFSMRGMNMLLKTRYVQARRAGKNVHFYTGTPITNTIAEAWTMMRYLRPDILEAANIGTFDEFVATFASRTTEYEMQGGIMLKPVERLRAFNNVSTLQQLWLQVSDEQTAEDAGIPRPPIEGGGRKIVDIPTTALVKSLMKHLLIRYKAFERMSPKDRYLNKHIPGQINNTARAAAVDIRLVSPELPDDPGSKLNRIAKEIHAIWKQTEAFDGAQVMFLDRFQALRWEATGQFEDDPETGEKVPKFRKVVKFNAFHEMKRKLVALGIPAEHIAVMTDPQYDAIDSREPAFEAVRQGKVRVVLASSERAGVGVNMQDRLVALHHADAPFTAAMMDQREGRINRQGNETFSLSNGAFKPRIIGWGVVGSYDSGQYERLSRKAKIQWQFRLGDNVGETIDDDEDVLSFAQAAAAITGNPLFKKRAELDNKIRELKTAEEEFQQGQIYLQRRIEENRREAEAQRDSAKGVRRDIQEHYRPFAEKPEIRINNGATVSSEEEINKALKDFLELAASRAETRLRGALAEDVRRGNKRVTLSGVYALPTIDANGKRLDLEVSVEAASERPDAPITTFYRVGGYNGNGWVKSHIGIVNGIETLMSPDLADARARAHDARAKALDADADKSQKQRKTIFEEAEDLEKSEAEMKGVVEELARQGNDVKEDPNETDEWADIGISQPITGDADPHGGELDMGDGAGGGTAPPTSERERADGGFAEKLDRRLGLIVEQARADLRSLGIRRGRNTGSEVINRGLVNVAIIGAGTAAQKGVRGGRALGKIIRDTIATHAPALKDQAARVVKIARGLLADATKPDGTIDQDVLGRASDELASAAKLGEKGPAGVAKALRKAEGKGEVKMAKRAARETIRLVRRTEKEAEAHIDALVPKILRGLRTARRQGAALQAFKDRSDAEGVAQATKEREAIERGIRRQMAVLLRNMPAEVKANYTETIAAAKTPIDLARAVNRMRRDHALYRARMARRALARLVKPKRMARLDNKRRDEINRLVNSLGPDWQYTKEKGKTATGSLQVARTFVDTLERVRAIYGEHAAETRAIAVQEQMEREGKVKAAVANIRKAALLKTEPGVHEDPEVSRWERFKRGHLDVANMLRTIEGEWKDDSKVVILTEWQKLRGDEEKYFNLRRGSEERMDKAAKRAGFKGLGDAMMLAVGSLGESSLKRASVTLGGRKVRIKLDELMHLAALDEDTRGLIDQGAAIKLGRGTLRKGLVATLEEIDAAVAQLTPEQRRFVRESKRLIDERRPAVFKVIRYLTGREPKMIWGYFPRSRDSSVPDSGLPAAWRSSDLVNKYLENADLGKERTGGKGRAIIVGGLIRTTMDHLDETSKIMSFAVRVRRIEALIRHQTVQDEIVNRFGAGATRMLREHLAAATRANEQPHTGLGRVLQAVASRISGAFLALNERTWLRQLGGIARVAPALGMRDFLAGVAGMARKGLFSHMLQNSGYLWARYHGDSHARFSPTASSEIEALDEPQIGQSIKAVLRAMRKGRPLEAMGRPMQRLFQSLRILDWFDSMTARVAWVGFEHKAKREYPDWSERERTSWVATKVADAIRDTQNSTSPLDLSGVAIHLRGTALQPFLAFTSDPFRTYNRWVRARKQGAKAAAGMAAAEAVNVLWSAAVTGGSLAAWSALAGGGDEDKKKRIGERMAWGVASEMVSGFIPGGTVLGSGAVRALQSATRGLPAGDAVLDAPVFSVINETLKAGADAIAGAAQMADEDPDRAERGQRKLGRALLRMGEGGAAMWGNPVYVPMTRIRGVIQKAMQEEDE